MHKDDFLKTGLARMMIGGVIVSAAIILAGLLWFLVRHPGISPGDHIFSGEPVYFDNPIAMVHRALDIHDPGHIRSLIMIGIVLLLLNPLFRVAFAIFGFSLQRDHLYTGISAVVFLVLVFSFFW